MTLHHEMPPAAAAAAFLFSVERDVPAAAVCSKQHDYRFLQSAFARGGAFSGLPNPPDDLFVTVSRSQCRSRNHAVMRSYRWNQLLPMLLEGGAVVIQREPKATAVTASESVFFPAIDENHGENESTEYTGLHVNMTCGRPCIISASRDRFMLQLTHNYVIRVIKSIDEDDSS